MLYNRIQCGCLRHNSCVSLQYRGDDICRTTRENLIPEVDVDLTDVNTIRQHLPNLFAYVLLDKGVLGYYKHAY